MSLESRIQRLEGATGQGYDRIVVVRPGQSEDAIQRQYPGERLCFVRGTIRRAPTEPMLTGGAA